MIDRDVQSRLRFATTLLMLYAHCYPLSISRTSLHEQVKSQNVMFSQCTRCCVWEDFAPSFNAVELLGPADFVTLLEW